MTIPDLTPAIEAATREELPALLGAVVAAEARILRLSGFLSATPTALAPSRPLDDTEAATIAGTSRRWLNAETTGRLFRHDLSRKQKRYDESGLRAWLATRR